MASDHEVGSPVAKILTAVLAGEPEAVDAFCRDQHPRVFRLCVGFLACAVEAEDLAQDAMLHLLEHLPRYDAARAFDTWRNRVVLNLCRDRLRLLARRRRAESAAAEHRKDAVSSPPVDALDRADLRDALTRALSALPQREREALVLRDLEGNAAADVAAAMGITRSSVRSLTTLARRRLRDLLTPTVGPEISGEVRCD